MRWAFAARTVVAKDTMSAMVKLAVKIEIEEAASNVIGYGMVSHLLTCSRDEWWRAILSSPSLGRLISGCQLMAYPSKRRLVTWRGRCASFSQTRCRWTIPEPTKAAQDTTFRSVKGGVDGTKERALSSCTDTLRCKIHCRAVSNGMRVN